MNKFLLHSGVLLLCASTTTVHAQNAPNANVYCDNGQKIQDAVDRVGLGARIEVYGTCEEVVVIPVSASGLEMVAVDGATLQVPGGTGIRVSADGVVIEGFEIVGGSQAVEISNGASATLRGNSIRDCTGFVAVNIAAASYAGLFGNVFSTSGNCGAIFVGHSSSARILFNNITASSGIAVQQASSVQAGGNVVSATCEPATPCAGLAVDRNAHTQLLGNTWDVSGGGPAISCGRSGSLDVVAAQNVLDGTIAVDPDCHVLGTLP